MVRKELDWVSDSRQLSQFGIGANNGGTAFAADPLLRMPQHGSYAPKLPVQERQGYHAAPAQAADKAEGRVSAAARSYIRACRSALTLCAARMPRDRPSLHSAVTAPRNAATMRYGTDRIYVGTA